MTRSINRSQRNTQLVAEVQLLLENAYTTIKAHYLVESALF